MVRHELKREAEASVWAITLQQLRDPMNIMLVAVTVDKTTTR
jgi:cation transport ATPase-like protein